MFLSLEGLWCLWSFNGMLEELSGNTVSVETRDESGHLCPLFSRPHLSKGTTLFVTDRSVHSSPLIPAHPLTLSPTTEGGTVVQQ